MKVHRMIRKGKCNVGHRGLMGGRVEGIYSVMGAGAGAWTIFRHLGNFSLSLPSPFCVSQVLTPGALHSKLSAPQSPSQHLLLGEADL